MLLAGIIFFAFNLRQNRIFGLLLGLSVLVINIVTLSIYLSLKGG